MSGSRASSNRQNKIISNRYSYKKFFFFFLRIRIRRKMRNDERRLEIVEKAGKIFMFVLCKLVYRKEKLRNKKKKLYFFCICVV